MSEEIFVAAILTVTLMLILVGVIVVAVVKYQNRYKKHLEEIEDLRTSYDRELLYAQLEIQERTLRTISQEIHDNVGQVLSLVKLNFFSIPPQADINVQNKVDLSKELITKAIYDLRNLSKTLNPDYLKKQLFSDLIQAELEILRRSGSFQTTFIANGSERSFESQKQLIVFRIFQESINNIIKHSKANTVSVTIDFNDDKADLQIKDDGNGFPLSQTEDHPRGTGIGNMIFRAKLIGASLDIASEVGSGCCIRLQIPKYKTL